MLGSLAIGDGPADAAAPAGPVRTVALLNVEFVNDHADLEPTTSAERARLTSIASLFKAKLEASGRYEVVSVPPTLRRKSRRVPR